MATIDRLGKEWRVSFEVKPQSNEYRSYASVLHLTTLPLLSGEDGSSSCARSGDRTPAVWLHPSRGVLVSSALNGTATFSFNIPPKDFNISISQWSKMEVNQIFTGEHYTFSILINSTTVFLETNNRPEVFFDVNIFASNPWASPQNGTIKGLIIESKEQGKRARLSSLSVVLIKMSIA